MAEVNLRSWSEISQASEGLQLNSTAATLEHILARFARLETRLVEHERRVAATLPPLQPEPDPPDRPRLYDQPPPPTFAPLDQIPISPFGKPLYTESDPSRQPWNSHAGYQPPGQLDYQPPSPYQPPSQPQRNAFNAEDQFVNMPYRMATAWDLPETRTVLEPQAVQQTLCWDSPTLRSHQGYHSYEQPSVVQQPLPQRSPFCWNPPSRHCSLTAPLPAAATPPHADHFQRRSHLHLPSSMEKEWEWELRESAGDRDGDERLCHNSRHINKREETCDEQELIANDNDAIDRLPERDQVRVDEVLLDVEEILPLADAKLLNSDLPEVIAQATDAICSSVADIGSIYANTEGIYGRCRVVFVRRESLHKVIHDRLMSSYLLKDDIDGFQVDWHVGDVASLNHRSTSLDVDARLIPPWMDAPCLSIRGSVDKTTIVALNYHDPKGPPLVIFDGDDEGRRFPIRCAFDPGGNRSPKLLFATLFVISWFPP